MTLKIKNKINIFYYERVLSIKTMNIYSIRYLKSTRYQFDNHAVKDSHTKQNIRIFISHLKSTIYQNDHITVKTNLQTNDN